VRVKNWSKFQHYNRRNPPWIKLYRSLLDDKDFHDLDGDAVKCLVKIWLIAAETNGILPASDVLAFRLRIDSEMLATIIPRISKWLDGASDMLASCKQSAIPEAEAEAEANTETETETEAEAEQEKTNGKTATPAAAFLAIGFVKPFGHKPFRKVFLDKFSHWKPGEQWLTDVMEETGQECDRLGIKVPPQFWDGKRDVEAKEMASLKKRVPL
jgi:hypothetical protein